MSSVHRSHSSSAASASGQYCPYPRLMRRLLRAGAALASTEFVVVAARSAPIDVRRTFGKADRSLAMRSPLPLAAAALTCCMGLAACDDRDLSAGIVAEWNEQVLEIARAEDKFF